MAPKPKYPSDGHRLLAGLAKRTSLAQIGAACKVSKQAVHRWISKGQTPTPEIRAVLEDHFQILASSWERAPGPKVAPKPAPKPSAPSTAPAPSPEAEPVPEPDQPATALEALRAHVVQCIRRRKDAEEGNGPSGQALKDLVQLERQAIVAWGRATGEMSPGDETRLTTSNRYLRIQGAIVEALRKFPDAAEAVIRALAEVEPEVARAIEQTE